jgi:hypothetical protein
VTGWVLGFGEHAWVVEPAEARAAIVERLGTLRAAVLA